MLEDGLSYPMKGDEWIGRFAIGGVLTFLGFLLFPVFLINGYFIRVLEGTINAEEEPPAWEDWGGLFVDGLKMTVVSIAYAIVPVGVFGVIAFVLLGLGSAAGGDGGGILAGFGVMTMVVMLPAIAIVYYLIPAALGNMAREGSVAAAFDFAVIKDVALSTEYLVAVLLPVVVGIITNVITFFLAITVIGYLLVPFVSFYGQLAVFRMFGLAFRQTAGGSSTSQSSAAAPASGF